jgi:sugar lactone lactonase YvrE
VGTSPNKTSTEIRARCLVNPRCSLGEGPVWDAGSERLYWVDILENRIYRYDPADQSTRSWSTPENVGFVVPRPDGALLAGYKSGLHRVVLDDDGSVAASRVDRVDGHRQDVRFNDATFDAEGRLWACTLGGSPEEPLGTYYCYDAELSRRTVDDGYLVANGPALSPDSRLLYTVETAGHPGRRKGVYVSRVAAGGALEGQRLLVDWAYDSAPDGVVTDRDGNLWLGEFHGNALRCFSSKGEEIVSLPLTAWNITKAAFGGTRGDLLYVTSARVEVDDETLARYPDTGGVIEVAGTGASGPAPSEHASRVAG